MSSGPLLPTASLAPVFITAVICAIIGALYALLEIEAHLFVEFVLSVAPLVAALIWIRTDAEGGALP